MATFKIELPVRLEITVSAKDSETALQAIDTAFAHAEPITSYVKMIQRRGEQEIRAEVRDAVPTGEASLVEEVAQ